MTSTDLHEETTSAANVDPIPAQPIPQPRGRPDGVSVVSHGVLFVWSIIVIAPLLWTLLSSFKTSSEIFSSPFSLPADWNLDNFRTAWTQEGFGNYFLNTIVIVGSALVIVMTLGSMCAYVLARFRFPGSRLIYYLMLAGLTFPVFLAIVPLFLLMRDIGLLNRQPGLVVVYVAFALPFTVFFLYPFFKRLPKPGVVSVAIFNFLGLWNQFLLPVSLNTDQDNYVLSQGLSRFASQAGYAVDFGALFASVMIVVVPVLIMYVIFQRQLRGSVAQGTIK